MKLTSKLKTLSKHAAFVTAYFLYETGMLYAYTGVWIYFWDTLWHLLINLTLFYFNAQVVLTYCNSVQSNKKRLFYTLILIAIEFLSFLFIKYILAITYIQFEIKGTNPYTGFNRLLLDTIWRLIYIMGLSFAYWFALNALKKQRELNELESIRLREIAARENAEKQTIEAENAFLKSQINSHFLFNTLNFLHNSVQKISEQAGETIIYLSRIMRYALDLPYGGKVNLHDELEHIHNLIQINKLKSNGKFYIEFKAPNETKSLRIIPLILITITENLFKHGNLKDETNPALILCDIDDHILNFKVSNKKRNARSHFNHGIGLENIRKRLELAYGEKYHLTEVNQIGHYEISLTVTLEE